MFKTIDVKTIDFRTVYHLMISGISPRPIAFVSTLDLNGNSNLAPYSFFNGFGANPPIIGFSPALSGRTGLPKDTLNNVKATKEFSISIVNNEMVEQMAITSNDYPSEIDEFEKSGFSKRESHTIKTPYVKESPFTMECKLYKIIELGNKPASGNLILGEILCFHINESVLSDNKIDPMLLDPISRMGYSYYSRASKGVFSLPKPQKEGIGFDKLPKHILSSSLKGRELAKLASSEKIPNYKKGIDKKLSYNDIICLCSKSIQRNDINVAWQYVHRLGELIEE